METEYLNIDAINLHLQIDYKINKSHRDKEGRIIVDDFHIVNVSLVKEKSDKKWLIYLSIVLVITNLKH